MVHERTNPTVGGVRLRRSDHRGGRAIALYELANIDSTVAAIASQTMPATGQSLQLAVETKILVASAPRLMTVKDEAERTRVDAEIARQAKDLTARFEHLPNLDATRRAAIGAAEAALAARLAALSKAVTARIAISSQRNALAVAIGKLHGEGIGRCVTARVDRVALQFSESGKLPMKLPYRSRGGQRAAAALLRPRQRNRQRGPLNNIAEPKPSVAGTDRGTRGRQCRRARQNNRRRQTPRPPWRARS
jgi:hypothetical protein